eukprot:m.95805 g.95805  ORF g.95805 m.95805 type:complete len:74 (-) comp12446_c0_seq5:1492-1713(-)
MVLFKGFDTEDKKRSFYLKSDEHAVGRSQNNLRVGHWYVPFHRKNTHRAQHLAHNHSQLIQCKVVSNASAIAN